MKYLKKAQIPRFLVPFTTRQCKSRKLTISKKPKNHPRKKKITTNEIWVDSNENKCGLGNRG